MWWWLKNKQIDQRNRIESPETGPHKYRQLVFDEGAKVWQWRKDSFSTNHAGTTGHTHAKNNLDTDLTCFTKIKSYHRPKHKMQISETPRS